MDSEEIYQLITDVYPTVDTLFGDDIAYTNKLKELLLSLLAASLSPELDSIQPQLNQVMHFIQLAHDLGYLYEDVYSHIKKRLVNITFELHETL